MGERASLYFPFVIAVLLPPAGLVMGLIGLQQEDRDQGVRLLAVSVLAAIVWTLLFVA